MNDSSLQVCLFPYVFLCFLYLLCLNVRCNLPSLSELLCEVVAFDGTPSVTAESANGAVDVGDGNCSGAGGSSVEVAALIESVAV